MLKGLKIVIAGGTGFMGNAIANTWADDNEVIILTRQSRKTVNNSYGNAYFNSSIRFVVWGEDKPADWIHELEGTDILINLAGRSVNCSYTKANREEIMNSRVSTTKVLGNAVKKLQRPPALWLNASSATIYRHATDRPQDEETGDIQNDFSVQVCKEWEKAFNEIELTNTRKIIMRTAITLGSGGVLVPYKNMVKYGLGGRQGSGRQMFSWVHIDDVCRIVEWFYENKEASGVYNLSAPHPVSNEVFMHTLRSKMHVGYGLPSPAWLLKLGAMFIATETELVLKSRWVLPTRLQREGYVFKYQDIDAALRSLV